MNIKPRTVRGDAMMVRKNPGVGYSSDMVEANDPGGPTRGSKAEEYVETADEEITIKKNPMRIRKTFTTWSTDQEEAEYEPEPEYEIE